VFQIAGTISSQGRYDHFDTPPGVFHPKIISRKKERTLGENFAPLSPGGIRKALSIKAFRKGSAA